MSEMLKIGFAEAMVRSQEGTRPLVVDAKEFTGMDAEHVVYVTEVMSGKVVAYPQCVLCDGDSLSLNGFELAAGDTLRVSYELRQR